MSAPDVSQWLHELRADDHDRYITLLFASTREREFLATLYRFNLEIVRIADAVSEPMVGHLKVQWWRDRLNEIAAGKDVPAHPVAQGLAYWCNELSLDVEPLQKLIRAREYDLEPQGFLDGQSAQDYAKETGGRLLVVAACGLAKMHDERLHAADEKTLLTLGACWAELGLVRSLPWQLAREDWYFSAAWERDEFAVREHVLPRLEKALSSLPLLPKFLRPVALLQPLAQRYVARLKSRQPIENAGVNRVGFGGVVRLFFCAVAGKV